MATNTNISKKRKFVADGLFYAELNEFLQNELGEDGYAGVEVRVTPMRTEIIIRATRTQLVLGEKGRRIRELTSLVQKRFLFPEGNVELYAERSVAQQTNACLGKCAEATQSNAATAAKARADESARRTQREVLLQRRALWRHGVCTVLTAFFVSFRAVFFLLVFHRPPACRTVLCLPSPRLSLCASSCLEDLPSAALATE